MKTVAFAAVTSLVLLFVWERVDIVRIGYQIERLKTQKVTLERERDELRVKLSGLTARLALRRRLASRWSQSECSFETGQSHGRFSAHTVLRLSDKSDRLTRIPTGPE